MNDTAKDLLPLSLMADSLLQGLVGDSEAQPSATLTSGTENW